MVGIRRECEQKFNENRRDGKKIKDNPRADLLAEVDHRTSARTTQNPNPVDRYLVSLFLNNIL